RSGVYAEKRSVVIVDSALYENNWNGVAVSKDSKLWLEDTKISDNEKSGVHIILDESDIFVIDCDIEGNVREGLEINVFAKGGYAKIDNTNFDDNGRYGIARLDRAPGTSDSLWKDVLIKKNTFDGNGLGTVSPLIQL
ncbi:MAG: right-handed parallel beta-helix repeat-containing protein, partial [Candidatus Moranbacteria bacterium]|nr:right-handed parallel beta-helix repeat-containing protein [Candidatus Moranbacteria bacterium]